MLSQLPCLPPLLYSSVFQGASKVFTPFPIYLLILQTLIGHPLCGSRSCLGGTAQTNMSAVPVLKCLVVSVPCGGFGGTPMSHLRWQVEQLDGTGHCRRGRRKSPQGDRAARRHAWYMRGQQEAQLSLAPRLKVSEQSRSLCDFTKDFSDTLKSNI